MSTTAEKVYQNSIDLPESLLMELLHFSEFLKYKNQITHQLLDQKIQQGIKEADSGLGITIDDNYVNNLDQRVQQRLVLTTTPN